MQTESLRRGAALLPFLAALALSWADCAFAAPPPGSGDITVTSADDDDDVDDPPNGICTLREAINNADNHTQWNGNPDCASGGAEATIIRFGTSVRTHRPVRSITLNPAFGELSINATVTIAGPVTIKGVSGPGASRILHVTSGPGKLTLTNVTLSGGAEIGDSGGDLLVEGEMIMAGGALMSGNADRGGGMAVYGTATLARVELAANHANIEGGAIWASPGAQVWIQDGTLDNNRAEGPGGAVFQAPGTGGVTLLRTAVAHNRAAGPAGNGGGLYAGGVLSMFDSVVKGNQAEGGIGGAGLYLASTTNAHIAHAEITENSLSGLSPTAGGGGLYLAGGGTLTLREANVTRNTAWAGGGLLLAEGSLTGIFNTTIALNSADAAAILERADAGAGGGILLGDQGSADLVGVTVKDNTGTAQLFANGTGVFLFDNTVVWSEPGALNCGGPGVFFNKDNSFQNADSQGASCGVFKLFLKESDVFAGQSEFAALVSPPAMPLHHTTWAPRGPLLSAGNPATCKDSTLLDSADELGHPRLNCDVGAVER